MKTKMCTKCKIEKPISEFSWLNRTTEKPRYSSWCKPCASKVASDYQKRNWEKVKVYRATEKYQRYARNNWLTRERGITLEQYEARLKEQNGGCAICGKTERAKQRGFLAIDHDHSCCSGTKPCEKCIRGLLCQDHNQGLGNFHDSIAELEAAIAYLKKFKKE